MSRAQFDPEKLLLTLSADVAVLRRRVDELAAAVKLLAEQLDEGGPDLGGELEVRLDQLAAQIRQVAELQQAAAVDEPPVWEWASMTAAQAAAAWEELTGWIDTVLLPRTPSLLGTALGGAWAPCWYRHPEAVDELSALYAMWRQAYTGPAASAARVAEWRDRWLPGVTRRLTDILKPCGRGSEHHDHRAAPGQLADPAALADFIRTDLAHRHTADQRP